MEYRVLIQNKFAAIEIDDEVGEIDPFERINKLKEEEALAKKKAAAAPKPVQPKKPVPVEVESKNEKNASEKASPAEANGIRPNIANRPFPNRAVQNRAPRAEAGAETEVKTEGRPMEDRPYRGRGGFRRGRGGFRRGPEEATGRREYDRHSGNDKTGVKPHEKREGAGAHNWGSFKDDINEQMNEADAQEANSQDDLTKAEAAKENQSVEPVEEKELEPTQLTLDEYKKLQGQNRMKASFNVRKANEGFEDPKWSKMTVLKKNADEKEGEDENEEEEIEEKKDANKVNIRIMFNDARRGTRGRRGFNYEKRTPKSADAVPYVLDENDFPSL